LAQFPYPGLFDVAVRIERYAQCVRAVDHANESLLSIDDR
jgi:hypothetical protein